MSLEALKDAVRAIGRRFPDREERARRLYLTERPASLYRDADREFAIKTEISREFAIPYSAVAFCGSAQLGFSIHKDALFAPGKSDLDAACIDTSLFQRAWMDVIQATRAFKDLSSFRHQHGDRITLLKDQISKRGMIRVDLMPTSALSRQWSSFQDLLSREHAELFDRVSIAIYLNEYAFRWKQDSSLSSLMR